MKNQLLVSHCSGLRIQANYCKLDQRIPGTLKSCCVFLSVMISEYDILFKIKINPYLNTVIFQISLGVLLFSLLSTFLQLMEDNREERLEF
jgi:hypothetical protein